MLSCRAALLMLPAAATATRISISRNFRRRRVRSVQGNCIIPYHYHEIVIPYYSKMVAFAMPISWRRELARPCERQKDQDMRVEALSYVAVRASDLDEWA